MAVFPAFTFSGVPANAEAASAVAESGLGRTVQVLSDFAVRLSQFVVDSHPSHRHGDIELWVLRTGGVHPSPCCRTSARAAQLLVRLARSIESRFDRWQLLRSTVVWP